MEQEKTNNPIIKQGALGVLAIGLIASVGFYLSQDKNKSDEIKNVTVTETTNTVGKVTAPETFAVTYKDGAYTAKGTYGSPAGKEDVDVTVTLTNNTITAATFTGNATHPASKKWQAEFSKGFDQAVIGKKISDLSLTIVNGSSLTPAGFMSALEVIKTQAKI